jgi:SAM-dependent methyltransferase
VDIDPRWYEQFFGREWLQVAIDDSERTAREVAFIEEHLRLEPGSAVLDLACGHGRHAIELARRGYRVTGYDLSEPSLDRARQEAAEAGADVEWVRGDMRRLAYDARFDAAVNLFNSFAYFDEEADDRRVVAGIARALRPGGAFLLETINPTGLLSRFRAQNWEMLDDGTLLAEERGYDVRRGRSWALWVFVRPDGERSELRHSIRLYTYPELAGLLRAEGLEPEAEWGGYDGSELTYESFRLVVLARKPAA